MLSFFLLSVGDLVKQALGQKARNKVPIVPYPDPSLSQWDSEPALERGVAEIGEELVIGLFFSTCGESSGDCAAGIDASACACRTSIERFEGRMVPLGLLSMAGTDSRVITSFSENEDAKDDERRRGIAGSRMSSSATSASKNSRLRSISKW